MQKKIVAGICAAALALSMPVAAFAASVGFQDAGETDSSMVAKITDVKNGNVTLKNIQVTGTKGYAVSLTVEADGAAAAPSNAIAGSVASFKIKGMKANGDAVASFGTDYNTLTAQVVFAEDVTAPLPSTIDRTNLYVAGKFNSNMGGQNASIAATQLKIANPNTDATASVAAVGANGSITLENLGTGELTVWMQNGKYASDDATNAGKVADEAKDGSKSPKTGELL